MKPTPPPIKGIIKASERLARPARVNIALFARAGVGKTTQATTLDPATTMFIDLEAGTLALGSWAGDIFDVRGFAGGIGAHPWEFLRGLAVYIGGPDPSDTTGAYSQAVYNSMCAILGDPSGLDQYETIFLDSITVASRWAFQWAKTQPEAFSEKTGKADTRGAYGLLGQELIRWLTHLQHSKKSIIVSGILDRYEDDLKRVSYSAQIEGGKASRELDGIFDVVLTMDYLQDDRGQHRVDASGKKIRAFYPTSGNIYGFPAKDRSGTLESCEPPDLGRLIKKVRAGVRIDSTVTTLEKPADQSAQTAQTAESEQTPSA